MCIFYRDYGYSGAVAGGEGGGGTLDFKWRGSKGNKNENPKKSVGLPTESKQIAITKN